MASEAKGDDEMTQAKWKRVTEARYWEMLEILPPAMQTAHGFLVGEPWRHVMENGREVGAFMAFVRHGGEHFECSEALTARQFGKLDPAYIAAVS
jgi:hypothetical protein